MDRFALLAMTGDRHLYGRRKGKPLRTQQASLMADVLPALSIATTDEIHPATLFGRSVPKLHLEIGFGGGEHLIREARENPDIGFLGCEPFVNGVAKLVAQIEMHALTNIRIHAGDARDVLARLPAASLDRIVVLYPDPWPKRRQRKRRFISADTLAAMARCAKAGAELRFASDIDDYAGWTLAHLLRSPAFVWHATRADHWRVPWPGWQPTRYEEKARREGRDSAYLTFIRAPGRVSADSDAGLRPDD